MAKRQLNPNGSTFAPKKPLVSIAEEIGQAALEKSVKKSPAEKKDKASEPVTAANSPKVKDKPSKETPKEKDIKRATSNPIVKTLVTIGVILVTLGLLFAFIINLFFGIVLMILGSFAIIACVFLPVGIKQ